MGWLRFLRLGVEGAVRRERALVTPSLADRDTAPAPPHGLVRAVSTGAAGTSPSKQYHFYGEGWVAGQGTRGEAGKPGG